MAWGQIYCSSYWGDEKNKDTVPQFDTLNCTGGSSFNKFATNFDGQTPGESISLKSTNGIEINEQSGMTIMAWVKIDPTLETGLYNQKCIVDYSSDIFNTANGKGYSIFLRKTAATFTMNFFYKRVGLSRTQCDVIIDLNSASNNFDFSKPMLIVCNMSFNIEPNGSTVTIQNMRIWQDGAGLNGVGYVDGSTNTQSIKGTVFPTTQSLCFGNTNDQGTVSSEFIGQIDEVAIYEHNIDTNYIQFSNDYFDGRNDDAKLNLANLNFYSDIVGWYRFGDLHTVTPSGTLEFPNASNGIASDAEGDVSITSSDIVNGIIN